jgi:hypothetical protein
LVDPGIAVLTPKDVRSDWVHPRLDEVDLQDQIEPEKLHGVDVRLLDAKAVLSEWFTAFHRLVLPLYDYEGQVLIALG